MKFLPDWSKNSCHRVTLILQASNQNETGSWASALSFLWSFLVPGQSLESQRWLLLLNDAFWVQIRATIRTASCWLHPAEGTGSMHLTLHCTKDFPYKTSLASWSQARALRECCLSEESRKKAECAFSPQAVGHNAKSFQKHGEINHSLVTHTDKRSWMTAYEVFKTEWVIKSHWTMRSGSKWPVSNRTGLSRS